MHVHHFLQLKDKMELMVELTPRRKAHMEPHMDNKFWEVLRMFRSRNLHQLVVGRDFGHHSEDHFTLGYGLLHKHMETFIQDSTHSRMATETCNDIGTIVNDPTTYMGHAMDYNNGSVAVAHQE